MQDDDAEIRVIDVKEQGVVGKMFFPVTLEAKAALIVFNEFVDGFHERHANIFRRRLLP